MVLLVHGRKGLQAGGAGMVRALIPFRGGRSELLMQ